MDLTDKEREYVNQLEFLAKNPKFVEEVLSQPGREFIRGTDRPKMSPMGVDGHGGFSILVHLLKGEPLDWLEFI